MRSPARSFVALLAILAAFSLTAASCTDDDSSVDLGTAGRADVVEVVDAPAAVTARAVATLSAPADGTLAQLLVAPGTTVEVGQTLAVIDSPSAQQRLAQASEALAALSAGGGGVRGTDLSGVQRRTDEAAGQAFAAARDAAGKITDPVLKAALLAQVDAAERAYREASASARALIASVQRGLASVGQAMSALTAAQRTQARAAYDLAKSTVDALTLRAPVRGVVQLGGTASAAGGTSLDQLLGSLPAGAAGAAAAAGGANGGSSASGPGIDPAPSVGAQVSAGTPIVTVVDTAELGLLAEVDETDVLLVTPGLNASVELDAAPGARFTASVRSVDVLPTSSARGGVSYRVRLSLGSGTFPGGRTAPTPRPGMSAVAHLEVRAAPGALVVPATAVFSADGRDVVWVVRDGRAQRTPVTIGVAGADLVQITDGVRDGDRIVVRGTDQVRQGQKL